MFLDRAARVRAHLHGEQMTNVQLGAEAQQHGGDAGGIRVGEFGEIARAHHDFGGWLEPAKLDIARERVGEAKVNGIENGIENKVDFSRARLGRGALQRGEIAMRRGDENGNELRALRQNIEAVLVETKHMIGAGADRAR